MDLRRFTCFLFCSYSSQMKCLIVVCVSNSQWRMQCHPNRPVILPLQVQAGSLPDCNAQLHNDSAKQVEPTQTEAQAKVIITEPSRHLADTENSGSTNPTCGRVAF